MTRLLSPIAFGCAALATLSALNREPWYLWVTLAAMVLWQAVEHTHGA